MLGGAVIADVGMGEVYIYVGRERIAKANGNVNVAFEHHNPATGSWVISHGHSSYRTSNREERDAFGAELPLSTSFGGSSYVTSKFGELLFTEGSNPYDYSSGATLDGMPMNNSDYNRLIARAGGMLTLHTFAYHVNWRDGDLAGLTLSYLGSAMLTNLFRQQTSGVENKRGDSGTAGPSAATPCDVKVSGDRDRATVAVALGEGTPFRDRGQFPKPQVTNEAFIPLNEQQFRDEAYYMASVIANRFSGGWGSTYEAVVDYQYPRGGYAFLGMDPSRGTTGWDRLNSLGNNGDEYCERARYMMDALNYIFDQGHGTAQVLYWRGVGQPESEAKNGRRPFREGDRCSYFLVFDRPVWRGVCPNRLDRALRLRPSQRPKTLAR